MLKTQDRDFTDDVITCCIEDHDGNFWIGTHNGVLIRERNTEVIQHYNQNINNPYGLSDRAILSIYEDKNNIVWIGTYNGVNKYVRDTPRFRSYKFDIEDRQKNLNVIRSLYTEMLQERDDRKAERQERDDRKAERQEQRRPIPRPQWKQPDMVPNNSDVKQEQIAEEKPFRKQP